MSQPKLPIHSKFHSNIVVHPVSLWLFFIFFAALACIDEPYKFKTFFIVLGTSALVVLAIMLIILAGKKKLSIYEDRLVFSAVFGKAQKTYLLANLRDFSWGSRSVGIAHMRMMSKTTVKHEEISLLFEPGQEITISFDEYGNFDEIKKFLYSYSLRNKIITVRPLKERKRGLR